MQGFHYLSKFHLTFLVPVWNIKYNLWLLGQYYFYGLWNHNEIFSEAFCLTWNYFYSAIVFLLHIILAARSNHCIFKEPFLFTLISGVFNLILDFIIGSISVVKDCTQYMEDKRYFHLSLLVGEAEWYWTTTVSSSTVSSRRIVYLLNCGTPS